MSGVMDDVVMRSSLTFVESTIQECISLGEYVFY